MKIKKVQFLTIKKYLYEFLVIFLAVFLGFLSENLRESGQDRRDEEDYIRRLYRDIKEDSVILSELIDVMEIQHEEMSKLMELNKLDYRDTSNQRKLYQQINLSDLWQDRDYLPNTITLSQIKGTGAWKLMESDVADMITKYDQSIELFNKSMQRVNSRNISLLYYYQQIMDWYLVIVEIYENPNAPLTAFDATPRELRTFFNNVTTFYFTLGGHIGYAKNHQIVSNNLIVFLQQNYGLE